MSFWDPDQAERWAEADRNRQQACFKGGHVLAGASCQCGYRKAPAPMSKPTEKHTAKFRLRPISAAPFEMGMQDAFGYSRDGDPDWAMVFDGLGRVVTPEVPPGRLVPIVKTPEGYMRVRPGDYIVFNGDGRRVLSAAVFAATYEPVEP